MIKWIGMILCTLSLFGGHLEDYLQLLKTHSKTIGIIGDHESGEIEIVLSPQEIKEIEEIAEKNLLKQGISPILAKEWSRVGIIAEDSYLYWIRDGVIFPSGSKGTYDRILWKSGLDGAAGIAIFPLIDGEKVLLNLNYRHATRSWEIELPRGARNNEETLHAAAARELLEETGYHLDDALLLGTVAVDSGILTSLIPVVACKAIDPRERAQDLSEAILENVVMSIDELKTALLQGFWDIAVGENVIRAFVRDPFLTYALFQTSHSVGFLKLDKNN